MSGPLTLDVSLFDLAPRGVYLAADVTTDAGELLPHRFTHHPFGLVYSLLHLSSPAFAGSRTLSGSLPYGVRTFLSCVKQQRLPGMLRIKASEV